MGFFIAMTVSLMAVTDLSYKNLSEVEAVRASKQTINLDYAELASSLYYSSVFNCLHRKRGCGEMRIVRLTGGIASGKSTVSNLFKSHGILVVDADLVARVISSIYFLS